MIHPFKKISNLMICLLLLGYGQPFFSSVKINEQDVEALWDRSLSDDARKAAVISYHY